MTNEIVSESRAAVLLDTGFLYHSSKRIASAKINYAKLMEYLSDGLGFVIVRAIGLVLDTGGDKDNSKGKSAAFVEKLNESGIDTIIHRPRTIDGIVKTDCTIPLTTECVAIAPRVDAIIVATGNGDMAYPLKKIADMGTRVAVIGFGEVVSQSLMDIAHMFIDLGGADIFME